MTIITRHTSNASGRSQILAKGAGRQRTVSVDLSKSSDWNHGTAAGTLALALGLSWHEGITHHTSEDGTRHTFTF